MRLGQSGADAPYPGDFDRGRCRRDIVLHRIGRARRSRAARRAAASREGRAKQRRRSLSRRLRREALTPRHRFALDQACSPTRSRGTGGSIREGRAKRRRCCIRRFRTGALMPRHRFAPDRACSPTRSTPLARRAAAFVEGQSQPRHHRDRPRPLRSLAVWWPRPALCRGKCRQQHQYQYRHQPVRHR